MSNNLPITKVSPDFKIEKGQMLGQILIGLGKLNENQVLQILEEQKRSSCSFGEAAVKKTLLTIAEIDDAVARQFDYSVLSPDFGQPSSELVTAYDPFGDEAEAFRALRSQLILNGYQILLSLLRSTDFMFVWLMQTFGPLVLVIFLE